LAAFSFDSSLVAVVFNAFVTFWSIADREQLVFQEKVLMDEEEGGKNQGSYKCVEFGSGDAAFHLFVDCKEKVLKVWNLLNLTVAWKWSPEGNSSIDSMALDSFANRIAVFTSSKKLLLFPIGGPKPQSQISLSISPKQALFVPITKSKSNVAENQSLLVFADHQQGLFALLPKGHSNLGITGKSILSFEDTDLVQTPFAMMLLEHKERELLNSGHDLESSVIRKYFDEDVNADRLVEEMFLKVPSHVLPPLEKLCATFLNALLIDGCEPAAKASKVTETRRDSEMSSEDDDEMEVEESSYVK
jgi:hypothetical protein